MAAPLRYPTPPTQMRELAEAARERGLTFDEWWDEAVRTQEAPILTTHPDDRRPAGCVVWPSDSADCRAWREATEEARPGWERTYNRLPPSRAERSLALLVPTLEGAGLIDSHRTESAPSLLRTAPSSRGPGRPAGRSGTSRPAAGWAGRVLNGSREDTWGEEDGAGRILGRFARRAMELTVGQAFRLPDGTRIKRDEQDSFRVVRAGKIERGFPSPERAITNALDRSARGSQPDSLGGASRYATYEAFAQAVEAAPVAA